MWTQCLTDAVCVPGKDGGREAADDQGSEGGAAPGGGPPGAAQEAPAESDAEGERGAEGQCGAHSNIHLLWSVLTPAFCLFLNYLFSNTHIHTNT